MQNDFLTSLSHLSDAELVARVKSLTARERDATAQLVAHLAEIDTRDVHLRAGYPPAQRPKLRHDLKLTDRRGSWLRVRIHHLALRVADLAASLAFYSGVLGLSEVRRLAGEDGPRAVWLRAGDSVLMLERALRGRGSESGSAHLVAFAVDDLATWESRLARAGVPVVDRTAHSLYFADPDGHRVGLSVHPLHARGDQS